MSLVSPTPTTTSVYAIISLVRKINLLEESTMIKITLQNEEGKTFTVKQKSITTRGMRELIKFHAQVEKVEAGELEMTELQLIDEMIQLVADLFLDPRVTFDAIQDSISADDLMPTIEDIFSNAMGANDEGKKA
ncbi:hypothetical protein [Enterococcus phage vB_EfaS_Ef6.1]|nr:hypothetical protein [Enterococcus phage vB_EfaS_Ef6.1]